MATDAIIAPDAPSPQQQSGMGLTARQRALLDVISERVAEHGVAPSYDEMKAALGLASKNGVYRLVIGLEERGYIRRLPNKARAIEVLARSPACCPHCGGGL